MHYYYYHRQTDMKARTNLSSKSGTSLILNSISSLATSTGDSKKLIACMTADVCLCVNHTLTDF